MAHELCSTRTQSNACGHFLAAQREPSQREVGNVHPADKKNEECTTPQQIECLFDATGYQVLQRFRHGAEPCVDQDFFYLREALEIFIVQRVDLGLGLLQRSTG